MGEFTTFCKTLRILLSGRLFGSVAGLDHLNRVPHCSRLLVGSDGGKLFSNHYLRYQPIVRLTVGSF